MGNTQWEMGGWVIDEWFMGEKSGEACTEPAKDRGRAARDQAIRPFPM